MNSKCKVCGRNDELCDGISDMVRFARFPERICRHCMEWAYFICIYCAHFSLEYPESWEDWHDKRDGFCNFQGIPKHKINHCKFLVFRT